MRDSLLVRFPDDARIVLSSFTDADTLHVVRTRLILLGVINSVVFQFPDFHQVTLQFVLDVHYARQRHIDQAAAHHHC